jgi:tetrahydromethanopterin S-methyltransferase subunit B
VPVTVVAGLLSVACGTANHSSADSSADSGSPDSGHTSFYPDAGGYPDAGSYPEAGTVVGQLDAGPDSNLSMLSPLTNVTATEREDSVGIDFDPVDNAVDYRVYALPAAADLTTNSNGSITIRNGVYRCAGLRQTLDLPNNIGNSVTDPDAGQAYVNSIYSWTATVPATPTLGYVYLVPTSEAVPVYAVAIHPESAEVGWRESRAKIYTTSATTRSTLLSQGARDDGIVFYVPSSASSGTTTMYHSEEAMVVAGQGWTSYTEYYFTSGSLSGRQGDSTPPSSAFQILTTQVAGSVPLMSVMYNGTQTGHVELSVGRERFRRSESQGPGPLWHLEWSGITASTTLVVEALASGCPYQGFLSPQSVNAPPHQPLDTLSQLAAASPTGEVYINGEYDVTAIDGGLPLMHQGSNSPVPIARSYVQVTPQPHDPTAWDWYEGFNVDAGPPAFVPSPDPASCSCDPDASPAAPCGYGAGACGYWNSAGLSAGAYEVDSPSGVPLLAFGQFLGQFWEVFDDFGQDVTGTLRFTAPKTATLDTDPTKFLHVTWSVDTVSTDRRYPQLIVSDQPSPIEDAFSNPDSNFLLIQPILGPSMRFEVEAFHGLFDGKPWAVNNQAPDHALIDYDNWATDYPSTPTEPPAEPPFEHAGMDRITKYDAYISSTVLYAFMDGTPAGCMQYPSNGFALTGAVTVTFGDVLYHEGAGDELVCSEQKPYAFMHEHQCTETKRHWDDLGFKSGVAAPPWNDTLFPCIPY